MSRYAASADYVDRDRDEYAREASHYPTRPVNKSKAEEELSQNIKKATSTDETAPKAKHVRKCIVYTWDYHTSASIWTGLRVLPILSDEVQTFKALITVHKIMQEGHKVVLKEAQQQTGWLETCARTVTSDGQRGYVPLIRAYVTLLLAKLRFHKNHKDFNGLFEYEEYVSLRGIDDPNEGYETISDLMNLQDQIDSFMKLIFAHFRGSTSNECRISALVPANPTGFITSMLRAMHRRTDAMDALEPLRSRFNAQHFNLRKQYYECANLKYLTSLINVPKLPNDPPNLSDSGDVPDLPRRPQTTAPPKSPSPPPRAPSTNVDEQARMLAEFEAKKAEQDRLAAEARRLGEQQVNAQREFEDAQRRAAEERARQEAEMQRMMQAQQAQHYEGTRVAELEREILAMRGQYERDQMMLEQYDRRVKALEMELQGIQANIQAQLASKDDMIRGLQDQVNLWRNKYEALAKLYTQLRTEHLDMLAKFKQMQLKANSAQEVVDRMERMERDAKSKNLELADMIRERDRARFEVDRLKSSHKEELERLRRDLRFAEERADDASRNKSSEVQSLLSKYNRQITELEEALRTKQVGFDELMRKLDESKLDVDRVRAEKDQEIEILQHGMDETVQRLGDIHATQSITDEATTAQIDTLILDQQKRLNSIIDSIFHSCVAKIDDAVYEIESSLQQGNTTATPEYTLSTIERASNNANDFARVFCLYAGARPGGEHVEVIKTANELAQSIADVLVNTKGLTRLAPDDKASDHLVDRGKLPGVAAIRAFNALQSFRLESLKSTQKEEVAMARTVETRAALSGLVEAIEKQLPKTSSVSKSADIGDAVEEGMMAAAKAIEAATARLQKLMSRPKDSHKYSTLDIQVHDAILEAALAITRAIGGLIKAATDSQQEIVSKGRGTGSATAFYKKNHRWADGLVSAAKAVAFSTTLLIEKADGVVNGTSSLEELTVAANGVAASTAQLVQASRVKSDLMSATQDRLETAARAVNEAVKALVRQVKLITDRKATNGSAEDYVGMSGHDFRMREFEQQVKIQELDRDLTTARRNLADLRRHGYRDEED